MRVRHTLHELYVYCTLCVRKTVLRLRDYTKEHQQPYNYSISFSNVQKGLEILIILYF